MWKTCRVGQFFVLFIFFKFLSVNQKINRDAEIFGKCPKHLDVGASFSVFVVGESLAADIKIHCYLKLIQILLLSYYFKPDEP